jgi:hypothetical protein
MCFCVDIIIVLQHQIKTTSYENVRGNRMGIKIDKQWSIKYNIKTP